jgi:hypothetical protein
MAIPNQTTTTKSSPVRSANLDGTSFQLATPEQRRRMIASVEGDFGCGKTAWGLSAPAPIAFFKLDLNAEWTISQFAASKTIYKTDVVVPSADGDNAKNAAKTVLAQFLKDYERAVHSTLIRSVIIDTATELWELIRLAYFGKLTQVPPHFYTEANNAFRSVIRDAYDSDKNLILVHRLKDVWEDVTDNQGRLKSRKTGRKERAGFGELGFAVQVMVETTFDAEDRASPFKVRVIKCTQNPLITNRSYEQVGDMRMNSFPFLAADVFPGTDVDADWS